MIESPQRIRVSLDKRRPSIFDKIDEKSVKQVLQEATETRRRSVELSERLKKFLQPIILKNYSDEGEKSSKNPKQQSSQKLLTLKEDDVVEIINDIQDENMNVMDVRIPRLEAEMKSPGVMSHDKIDAKTRMPINEKHSELPIIDQQQAKRQYKMLKNILKETEENNRRNNDLIAKMQRLLLVHEESRQKSAKKSKPPNRISDVSDNPKISVKKEKRASNNSVGNSSITKQKRRLSRPKTAVVDNVVKDTNKAKRLSKIKESSSTTAIKTRSKVNRLSSDKRKSLRSSKDIQKPSKHEVTPITKQQKEINLSSESPVIDISDMIDAIGRRDTNNDNLQQYLNQLIPNFKV